MYLIQRKLSQGFGKKVIMKQQLDQRNTKANKLVYKKILNLKSKHTTVGIMQCITLL